MCGIAGIIGSNSDNRLSLNRMIKAMHHRGPDDSGVYVDADVAIGMTRLAILDLSPLGHQPMQSHCKRYWIVYNGECYNYRTIRKKLEASGDHFASNSDTEVVLQAYVKWGAACLQEMNGMFAFAIWDTQEKKLFAARDRFGIKPFYYTKQDGRFVFGSEIKTLLTCPWVAEDIDPAAVYQYLMFGHIQQPRTIFKQIQALKPGHYLTWQNDSMAVACYWALNNKSASPGSYEDACHELKTRVLGSVKQQLISDRPLGLFLSGGLDSASILACMVQLQAQTHTYSIGFEDNPFCKSEANEAFELAKYFNAQHEQITLSSSNVLNDIPKFFSALDQPSVDGLNTYLVSKYASSSMTVALSGLGGDELFAGYSRHALLQWKNDHDQWQWLSRCFLLQVAFRFPGSIGALALKARVYGESKDTVLNYTFARTLEAPGRARQLMTTKVLKQISPVEIYLSTYNEIFSTQSTGVSPLDQVLQLDLYGFMSSLLLRDMDAASMAHSLEVRFPLIDHELVEFAFSLPDEFKLKPSHRKRPRGEGKQSYFQSGSKRILMDAFGPVLPAGFTQRPKNGFKLPVLHWLKAYPFQELRAMVMDNAPVWEEYLDKESIERVIQNADKESFTDHAVWKILTLSSVLNNLKRVRN